MEEAKTNVGDVRATRREEWQRIIAEQQAGGRKASAFCRERGIPAWKFWYWRKALKSDSANDVGFVQVQERTARATTAQVWVDAGQWRVCVTPGFDAATLRRAVEALTAS